MSTEDDEKRSFVRLLLELPVHIYQARHQKETIGTCIDLSATGISLRVNDENYQPGEQVSLKMVPEDENLPCFEATAHVIRVTQWEDGYKLALKFESIR